MSSFLYNSISMIWGGQLVVADDDRSDLYHPRFQYNYQLRHPGVSRGDGFAGWPRSGTMNGDPSQAHVLGTDQMDFSGGAEPLMMHDTAAQRTYWIVGVVRDGANTPLGGAVVDIYLTATKTWVASATTDSNGIYAAGTPNVGVNHYAVANYGPNTLTGSSVNTLIPGSNPWG